MLQPDRPCQARVAKNMAQRAGTGALWSWRNSRRGSSISTSLFAALACLVQSTLAARGLSPADSLNGCLPYLGTGENGLPRCGMDSQDYMEGSWQRISKHCRPHTLEELGKFAYPYKSDCNPYAHLCTPETDVCRRKVLRITRFAWHPSKCSLETWDPLKLSKKIGARTVVYSGDSIQVQQFFSFKQMMGPAITNATDPNPDWTHFHTVDGGRFYIAGTQFLVGEGIDKVENQSLSVLPDSHWFVMAQKADILVFNTGHHWHRRDKSFENYETMARNVMQALKKSFKGEKIVFRTSNFGHHDCQNIVHPLANVSVALAFMENDPYQWMRPIRSEQVWQNMALEVGLADKMQYNNASIALLRGDGHVDQQHTPAGAPFFDCLHNCMPGVPDYWNWLFYNTVMGWNLPDRTGTATA